MASVKETKVPNLDPVNYLDALCEEFDGASFYGLEYIVDDFFQDLKFNPPAPSPPPIDWFGLYD